MSCFPEPLPPLPDPHTLGRVRNPNFAPRLRSGHTPMLRYIGLHPELRAPVAYGNDRKSCSTLHAELRTAAHNSGMNFQMDIRRFRSGEHLPSSFSDPPESTDGQYLTIPRPVDSRFVDVRGILCSLRIQHSLVDHAVLQSREQSLMTHQMGFKESLHLHNGLKHSDYKS